MTYRCKAENCRCKISLTQQITTFDWSSTQKDFIEENKCVAKKVADI